ncbi:MAG: hypothetical protein ABSH20_26385, partial [Tepidisphaeraceae bacterium]
GNKLKRFTLDPAGSLKDEETIVEQGLEGPRRMAIGGDGSIYVCDWGKCHQIKVFDPHGRQQRTIGKPGGPQLGIYDDQRMSHPAGLAVDGQGRLWVAEAEGFPKRLSIWNADGSFARAFYGPAKYGGGGALDPADASRLYYAEYSTAGGIEFAVDLKQQRYSVKSIFWRPEMMPEVEHLPGPAPERSFHVGGHQYMVNSYNGDLRWNQDRGTGIWRMDADHIARPVAVIGNAADMLHSLWGWRLKNMDAIAKLWSGQKPENVLLVWSDTNHDGSAQPEEVQWVAEDHSASTQPQVGGIGLEPLVAADLSVTTAFGTFIPAPRIDARGVPVYDLKQRKVLGSAGETRSALIAGDWTMSHRDADQAWVGCDLKGGRKWYYAPTPEEQIGGPGAMVSPTRALGPPVTPSAGDSGPMVAINGEMGAIFLLTMDGLFVQTLGGDARLFPPLFEQEPRRDWLIANITFQQEHFHPTINQTSDGNIYLVAGFQQCSIIRLDGWQGMRRMNFGELDVADQQRAGLPATSAQSSRKQGRPKQVIRIGSHTLDGDLSTWPAQAWMRIDERAAAAVSVDTRNLYVAFRTGDPQALDNSGREYKYLFKNGGAFDVMLGAGSGAKPDRQSPTAGDMRLLVTKMQGKPTAVVYRAVVPGAPESDRVLYESPVGKVVFEQVRQLGADALQLVQKEGDYELSVSLAELGIKPSPRMEILADIGILRGNQGRTMQRAYWSNQNTTIVSDLPSEARLQPGHWGVWRFE